MRWLSLSLVAVVLIATIGLGWLFDVLYQQYASEPDLQIMDEIQHAEALTRQMALTLSQTDDAEGFVQAWRGNHAYQLQLAEVADLALPQSLLKILKQGETLNLESDTDLSILYLLPTSLQDSSQDKEPSPDAQKVLILTIPVAPVAENQSLDRFWITTVFYLLLIALFLLWARPLIDRLITLRSTARAFGKGELSKRIEVGKASYISDLEREFNHMAQRIEDLVSDVKLLSSAVSHDLRTPLARIRMGLDTLSEETDDSKRQTYEDRINDHIDDMVELIESLLSYARLDQAMVNLEKSNVDLQVLIEKMLHKKQQEGIDLTLITTPESSAKFEVHGDATYLKMLCNNLIQNALQHCQQQVQITLQAQEKQLLLIIRDDGSGIAADLIDDVFKPFVRNRNSKHKGHGVGLAICKRVVEWHQGDIFVSAGEDLAVADDDGLKGAEFRVLLPKVNVK